MIVGRYKFRESENERIFEKIKRGNFIINECIYKREK
jgi:hypothetical protein